MIHGFVEQGPGREGRVGQCLTVVCALSVSLALTMGPLQAQEEDEECVMEGGSLVMQAEEEINEGEEADSPEEARQKYQRALQRIELALRQDPDNSTPYWLAGRAHVGLGQFEEADEALTRFIEEMPACDEFVEALRYEAWANNFNQGVRSYQAGEMATALERFENANLMLLDSRSLNNAALLHQQEGNLERSEELYRKSVEVAEEFEQLRAATVNLAELLRAEGRDEEALEIYEQFISEHPEATLARLNYAVSLQTAGHGDSARVMLEDLLEHEELSFDEWFGAGINLMQMEAFESARRAFEGARDVRPFDKPSMQNLMAIALGTGEFERAVAIGDTLVEWYPYSPDNYRNLAQALDRLERRQEVQQYIERMQGIPLEFEDLDLVQRAEGRYLLRGHVSGGTHAGQQVTVTFHFLDEEGEEVASREIEIEVPSPDELARFEIPVELDEPVVGFRYDRIGS